MLEMMFALGGMFFFGALAGWIADHLPERLANWIIIHIGRVKDEDKKMFCSNIILSVPNKISSLYVVYI